MNKPSQKLSATLNIEGLEKFQELLSRADTLTQQLQETLTEINNFEFVIKVEN